jgi:hypothetical protein
LDEATSPKWQPARLIPVADKQELRATSALLAVLCAVDEFGMAFVRPFGAHKGKLEAYTEVSFKLGDRTELSRPDGILRVRRGKRLWTALVEVKTAENKLEQAQIEEYLDVARQERFDCLITISNQIARIPGEHPVTVHGGKLRTVKLHHMSWSRVLTAAHIQKYKGIEDSDQAWILEELINYLEHANAGAVDFRDMGEHWTKVRSAVRDRTLLKDDIGAHEIAGRWEELLSFVALKLGRELGTDVQEILPRAARGDLKVRIRNLADSLVTTGEMTGVIRIPDTVGDMEIVADLRRQQVSASVRLTAPESGRSTAKINWLLRQLARKATDPQSKGREGLVIESWGVRAREASRSVPFAATEQDPKGLIPADNRDIVSFRVTLNKEMGQARRARGEDSGRGKRAFVDSVLRTVDEFYQETVQHLKNWQRPAPRLVKTDSARELPIQNQSEDTSASDIVSTDPDPHGEQSTGDSQ